MMLSLQQPTYISEHLDATSGRSFKCSMCDRKFVVKCALTKHILNVHCDTRPHTCEKCGRRFLIKASLQRHLLTHKEVECRPSEVDEKFYSPVQTFAKTYEEEQEFRGHVLQIHNKPPAPLPCGNCGKNFIDKLSLQQHITSVHFHGRRLYTCTKCNKILRRRQDSQKHCITCRNLRKPFICHHCDKRFIRKFTIRRHIINVHSQKCCLYACKKCNKIFKHKRNRKTHSITCGNLLKPFTCHHCDKRFGRKFSIRRHIINVHSQEYPCFACSQCNKTFKQKSDLRRHSIAHCKNLIQSYYICNQCNKKFISESNLRQHIIDVHSCDKRLCDCKKYEYGDKSKHEDNCHAHCSTALSIFDDQSKRSSVGLHSSSYPEKDESSFVCEPKVSYPCALNSSDDPKFENESSNYSTPPDSITEYQPDSTIQYQYYSCSGCCESFESYDMLIKHVQLCAGYDSILNRENEKLGPDMFFERQFWCGVCYLSFVSLRTFISHLKLEHSITFLYHKCDDSCYNNIR